MKILLHNIIMPPPLIGDDAVWRLSVCLSCTSGLSREQRVGVGRQIGTEVAHVTRDSDTTRSTGQNQGHHAALLTAALTRQAAPAVSVGTYWPREPTATLRSAFCRRGRLGGARRFGAHRGRRGAGARLQLVLFVVGLQTTHKPDAGHLAPPPRWLWVASTHVTLVNCCEFATIFLPPPTPSSRLCFHRR